MKRFVHPAMAVLIVSGIASTAVAQVAPNKQRGQATPQPEVIRLVVDPAAEPRPALKYHLLPRASERKPGNAAQFYYRAAAMYLEEDAMARGGGRTSITSQMEEWQTTPLENFPKDEVRKLISSFSDVFAELQTAVYREECNWEWRFQDLEGMKGLDFRLEEAGYGRDMAKFLAVKTRLEIVDGKYDEAIKTLRAGYQLGVDIAKTQFFISALTGVSCVNILDQQVDALIQAPGSPNLYWAFTELPRPLIDHRSACEFELEMPFRVFPFLRDPESAQHSPEQWAELISQADRTLRPLMNANDRLPYGLEGRLSATAGVLKVYARAKHDLIDAGYDAAKVEAMPVGQVIAIHEARICREVSDELRKWTLLPYPEARGQFSTILAKLKATGLLAPPGQSREALQIANTLMPAISPMHEAIVRRDIPIAAHRVIEAIRMHAAAHDGKLPRSLDDISIVTVPNNPRFDQPFAYRVEGNTGVLEVRRWTTPDQPFDERDQIFEIVMRRK